MINELPTEVSYSYKNIFLYICLFLLVAGGIGTAVYFLIFRKKSCKTDKDCKSGQTCNGGKCQSPASGCKDDSDCAKGNICVNGQCQPVAPSSGCKDDSD
jgi:Cys-rich repeat protein